MPLKACSVPALLLVAVFQCHKSGDGWAFDNVYPAHPQK